MITKTYYNFEEKIFNSPEGMGVWGWVKTAQNESTNRLEVEAKMAKKKASWDRYLDTLLTESIKTDDISDTSDHIINLQLNSEFRIVEEVKTFTHVSEYCYSDVHAYEIVKVISDKTIEIRRMSTKHDIAHLNQFPGGFSGHTENQHNQKVTYASESNNPIIRIQRKKNNSEQWTRKGVNFGLTEAPYAFYDYNF